MLKAFEVGNEDNFRQQTREEENMSFDKIGQLAAGVVLAAAVAGHLDSLNRWVQVATAKIVWESRTATWGSPIFFPEKAARFTKPITNQKEVRNAHRK